MEIVNRYHNLFTLHIPGNSESGRKNWPNCFIGTKSVYTGLRLHELFFLD